MLVITGTNFICCNYSAFSFVPVITAHECPCRGAQQRDTLQTQPNPCASAFDLVSLLVINISPSLFPVTSESADI